MPDFAKIKSHCDNSSRILKSVVDDFLLYYVGENEGQIKRIGQEFRQFREILRKTKEDWIRSLISQLLAFELFKKDGRACRLFNHPLVQKRSQEELEYLKFQIDYPWRFSFCSIENYLLHDFYMMKDVINDERFLLYSPGISESNIEAGHELPLWFILIGFNGECYQTYGPLAYYKGIQPFDLFFFAKQIQPDILFLNEVQKVIESNPIPFSMLFFAGAEIPVTCHKKDMLVFNKSEFHVENFSLDKYNDDFLIEKKHPIYQLSLKRWHSFPHFAKCFYHAKRNLFIITSMTLRGYDSLISALNKQGNEFPLSPEILATPSMLHIAKKVLNVDVDMSPYEKHFAKTATPAEQKELDKINAFLKSLIPKLNNNEDYDISELAKKAGIEISDAERIAENMIKSISRMPR
jgi:hypothetical protein